MQELKEELKGDMQRMETRSETIKQVRHGGPKRVCAGVYVAELAPSRQEQVTCCMHCLGALGRAAMRPLLHAALLLLCSMGPLQVIWYLYPL
jgi:hypothetical protein